MKNIEKYLKILNGVWDSQPFEENQMYILKTKTVINGKMQKCELVWVLFENQTFVKKNVLQDFQIKFTEPTTCVLETEKFNEIWKKLN